MLSCTNKCSFETFFNLVFLISTLTYDSCIQRIIHFNLSIKFEISRFLFLTESILRENLFYIPISTRNLRKSNLGTRSRPKEKLHSSFHFPLLSSSYQLLLYPPVTEHLVFLQGILHFPHNAFIYVYIYIYKTKRLYKSKQRWEKIKKLFRRKEHNAILE